VLFLDEISFYALLDIEGRGFKRVMIPIARLLMTYQLKILLGIPSITLVPTKLFREIALLKLIGYTTTQMQVGFCQRGNRAAGPMHKNTLGDAVERLSADELEQLLNETAQRLAQRKKGKKEHVKGEGQVSVVGVADLQSYDQYGDEEHVNTTAFKDFVGNALNAVVVTKWQGEAYEAGKEKVFLTSLPIPKPLAVLDRYEQICLRVDPATVRRRYDPLPAA